MCLLPRATLHSDSEQEVGPLEVRSLEVGLLKVRSLKVLVNE
jgi:hypothetical protein